jgi:ribonuclease HII
MHNPNIRYLIGIDEAGRGPLAGPVAVGVVMVPIAFEMSLLMSVRDSKQLSAEMREFWLEIIRRAERADMLRHAVGLASAAMIDEKGIVSAINYAMARALRTVGADPQHTRVLLDGSLHAPEMFSMQETIIKGDEKEPLIALASIAAKVTRDRLMIRQAKRYPAYGFEVHKGYGTARHLANIATEGLSPLHRRSFCRSILALA